MNIHVNYLLLQEITRNTTNKYTVMYTNRTHKQHYFINQ